MQLHVPPAEHVNYWQSLRLSRPHNVEIPRPLNEFVWSWEQ